MILRILLILLAISVAYAECDINSLKMALDKQSMWHSSYYDLYFDVKNDFQVKFEFGEFSINGNKVYNPNFKNFTTPETNIIYDCREIAYLKKVNYPKNSYLHIFIRPRINQKSIEQKLDSAGNLIVHNLLVPDYFYTSPEDILDPTMIIRVKLSDYRINNDFNQVDSIAMKFQYENGVFKCIERNWEGGLRKIRLPNRLSQRELDIKIELSIDYIIANRIDTYLNDNWIPYSCLIDCGYPPEYIHGEFAELDSLRSIYFENYLKLAKKASKKGRNYDEYILFINSLTDEEREIYKKIFMYD